MRFPSTLGKMKAGSLPPAVYGELEDFFSSVNVDFAISGRTSLLTVCRRLQKAKTEKISAKRVKDAERMIKAICTAAEMRVLQYGRAGLAAQQGARMAAEKMRPMREGISRAAPATVPREILAERKRVADAAEKAGILPPGFDYRKTDLRHMAMRLGLEE